eukprot:TRINITY_DN20010_c0_g1_i1.p1 TRINITY_DN20010_c0_g1~~TRINITY_DN20010_c0_g1_i1.p1  ORF type:complete len:1272 (+),score=419.37 TRINITY_DN20010_c0_g1_i1:66-3818(+)
MADAEENAGDRPRVGELQDPRCGWDTARFQRLHEGLALRAAEREAEGKDVHIMPRRAAERATVDSAKAGAARTDTDGGLTELAGRVCNVQAPDVIHGPTHARAVELHQRAASIVSDASRRYKKARPHLDQAGNFEDTADADLTSGYNVDPRARRAQSNYYEIQEQLADPPVVADPRRRSTRLPSVAHSDRAMQDADDWGPAHIHQVLKRQRAPSFLLAERAAQRVETELTISEPDDSTSDVFLLAGSAEPVAPARAGSVRRRKSSRRVTTTRSSSISPAARRQSRWKASPMSSPGSGSPRRRSQMVFSSLSALRRGSARSPPRLGGGDAALIGDLSKAKAEVKRVKQQAAEEQKEREQMQKDMDTQKAKIIAAEIATSKLRGQVDTAMADLARAREELSDMEGMAADDRSAAAELRVLLRQANNAAAKAQAEMQAAQQVAEEERQRADEIEARAATAREEMRRVLDEGAEAARALADAQNRAEDLASQLTAAHRANAEQSNRLATSQERVQGLSEQLQLRDDQIMGLKEALEASTTEAQKLAAEAAGGAAVLERLRESLQEQREEIARAEERAYGREAALRQKLRQQELDRKQEREDLESAKARIAQYARDTAAKAELLAELKQMHHTEHARARRYLWMTLALRLLVESRDREGETRKHLVAKQCEDLAALGRDRDWLFRSLSESLDAAGALEAKAQRERWKNARLRAALRCHEQTAMTLVDGRQRERRTVTMPADAVREVQEAAVEYAPPRRAASAASAVSRRMQQRIVDAPHSATAVRQPLETPPLSASTAPAPHPTIPARAACPSPMPKPDPTDLVPSRLEAKAKDSLRNEDWADTSRRQDVDTSGRLDAASVSSETTSAADLERRSSTDALAAAVWGGEVPPGGKPHPSPLPRGDMLTDSIARRHPHRRAGERRTKPQLTGKRPVRAQSKPTPVAAKPAQQQTPDLGKYVGVVGQSVWALRLKLLPLEMLEEAEEEPVLDPDEASDFAEGLCIAVAAIAATAAHPRALRAVQRRELSHVALAAAVAIACVTAEDEDADADQTDAGLYGADSAPAALDTSEFECVAAARLDSSPYDYFRKKVAAMYAGVDGGGDVAAVRCVPSAMSGLRPVLSPPKRAAPVRRPRDPRGLSVTAGTGRYGTADGVFAPTPLPSVPAPHRTDAAARAFGGNHGVPAPRVQPQAGVAGDVSPDVAAIQLAIQQGSALWCKLSHPKRQKKASAAAAAHTADSSARASEADTQCADRQRTE